MCVCPLAAEEGQNSESLKLTQEIPMKVEEKGKMESHLTDLRPRTAFESRQAILCAYF